MNRASDPPAEPVPADGPTVSVVIPAYNAEGFVAEAIDSVLNQTLTDYEIIVVDDGSVDDTRGAVTAYGSRVRYFRQESGGASRARNRGIAESRGEFIAFLDADDLWTPTKLERQVAAFRADPSLGLVTTLHESFTPNNEVFTHGHRKREYLFSDGNLPRAIVVRSGLATPTVMLPRWVLDEVGVFDEDLAIAEDDNLWIRITVRHPAHLVDEVLVRCRLREGSLSRNLEQLFDDVIANLDRLMEDPAIREKIADGVPLRKSHIHWNRGYHAFDRGELKAARASFRQALQENPKNRSAWVFLAVSLLPGPVVRLLRRLRRS